MNISNIPDIFNIVLKEHGFKTRKKKNGDLLFWNEIGHQNSISFLDKQKTCFCIKSLMINCTDEQQIKHAEKCFMLINPYLHLSKLVVEEVNNTLGLYIHLSYTCYSEKDVRKFVPIMLENLFIAYMSARNQLINENE